MRHIKTFLVTAFLAAVLLSTGTPASSQVSIGIRIGAPPPPRAVRVLPARPGPDWVWIDGYWYASGRRWSWHPGYWTRPPYLGARWIAPRYEGGEFFEGYWDGDRGRFEHNHRWDHDKNRDYDRDHDNGPGRGRGRQ